MASNFKRFQVFYYTKLVRPTALYLFERSPHFYKFVRLIFRTVVHSWKVISYPFYEYTPIPTVEQRTIYLPRNRFSSIKGETGIGRVEKFFSESLLNDKDLDFRVVPVEWDGLRFILVDSNSEFSVKKKGIRKNIMVWNPREDDIIFLQNFSIIYNINKWQLRRLGKAYKIIINIYDILPISHPEWFKSYMNNSFIHIFDLAWKNAHAMIINCTGTRNEIEEYVSIKRELMESKHPLIKDVNLWSVAKSPSAQIIISSESLPSLFANSHPTILLLSTVEPRKGHKELIDAAKIAWANGAKFNLLFIGRLGWISQSFKEEFDEFLHQHPENSIWLNNVGDDELEGRINAADILISPSLGEGYGLPIPEALKRGKPVLANAIPPYKELFGSHLVLYGANEQFSDLEDALKNIMSVIEIGNDLIKTKPLPARDTYQEFTEVLRSI